MLPLFLSEKGHVPHPFFFPFEDSDDSWQETVHLAPALFPQRHCCIKIIITKVCVSSTATWGEKKHQPCTHKHEVTAGRAVDVKLTRCLIQCLVLTL